jgi:hypothetical protein
MVSYLYDLSTVEENHESYASTMKINYHPRIKKASTPNKSG